MSTVGQRVQFDSGQWKSALEEWGIEHWTLIYHPQANPTERRNQELKRLLRVHLVNKAHNKWDQHLHEILLSLRQRVNRVTGFSPAELFLGRPIQQTGDWERAITNTDDNVTPGKWVQQQQERLKRMKDFGGATVPEGG